MTWSIDSNGLLQVTGSGDYSGWEPDWTQYTSDIKTAKIKVNDITSLEGFFEGCENLTQVDISELDTGKVTNMEAMFYGCESLIQADISELDTGKVTNMRYMFYDCWSLTSLNISKIDTGKVTDMHGMFGNCKKLTVLDLTGFTIENGTKVNSMLSGCAALQTVKMPRHLYMTVELPGSVYWQDENGNRVLFANKNLDTAMTYTKTSISAPSILHSGVDGDLEWSIDNEGLLIVKGTGDYRKEIGRSNTDWVDAGWSKIKTAKIAVSDITNLQYFLNDCFYLTQADVSELDTGKVTNMIDMFSWCYRLSSLDLSGFDTQNVIYMKEMFVGCESLTSLNVSNFDTGKVTDMVDMFCGCLSLTSLDVSGFDTKNVTNMSGMFDGCESLTSLNVSNFDTGKVTNMFDMFCDCESLTSLDVSGFDTGKVTDMRYMFAYCSSLTQLDLSSFTIKNGTKADGLFDDCTGLQTIKMPKKLQVVIELPGDAYWQDEHGNLVTEATTNLDTTMTYTKTSIPYVAPSSTPHITPTFTPVTTGNPASAPWPTATNQSGISSNDVNVGIYEDSNYSQLASSGSRTLYANGGSVKQEAGSKINYQKGIYYTKLQASGITDKKKGKLVVGVTTTSSKPTIESGKIVDKEAAKIAKASVAKGKITVTAQKESGEVYVWVVDTGTAGASVCAKITVKAAPTAIKLYDISDTSTTFQYGKTKEYKKQDLGIGETATVYFYPNYKNSSKEITRTTDATYSVSLDSKSSEYFEITGVTNTSSFRYFTIKAKKLKDGKKVTGTVNIVCKQNNKKAAFKVTALNHVTALTPASPSGGISLNTTSAIPVVKVTTSATEKTTGTVELNTTCNSSTESTTDSVKVYAMGSAGGYDTSSFEKGKVKIITKPDKNQKKIQAKIGKDKKTLTITIAKGTQQATAAYFLVVYNTQYGGYKVIEVTAN